MPDDLQESWEQNLLALVVWREASNQTVDAKLAVAWSIRNRVLAPGWWGTDWTTVITKRWQYSSMTAPNDPNLIRWPIPTDTSWQASLIAAEEAYTGSVADPTGGAQSYYSVDIPPPNWTSEMTFTVQIGAMRFYRR